MLTTAWSANRSSGIPGDSVTYTASVTNSGSKLKITGVFKARNASAVTARVESFFDDVEYHSVLENRWVPLAGKAAAHSGYTPLKLAPITTGLTLSASGAAASGVTYPSSGDPFVATELAPGSTASWTYEAELSLTPAQLATVFDTTRVDAVRNVVHFEAGALAGAQRDGETRAAGLTKQLRAGSPNARNVDVTEHLPGGATKHFDQSTTPSLASIAPGASASVQANQPLAAPAARGPGETDAQYLTRLRAADNDAMDAALHVQAKAGGTASEDSSDPLIPVDVLLDDLHDQLVDDDVVQGLLDLLLARERNVVTGPLRDFAAPDRNLSVTRRLPVVSLAKAGPEAVGTPGSAFYELNLANEGGAAAAISSLTDAVGSEDPIAVANAPQTLAPSETALATVDYSIDEAKTPGALTDVAAVRWTDANGTVYGPLSSSFTTTVQPWASVARGVASVALTPSLAIDVTADRQSAVPGDAVRYSSTVRNTGADLELAGSVSVANTASEEVAVAMLSDYVEYYSVAQSGWVTLAAASRTRNGYLPGVAPPSTGGMTIQATDQPASGVTYPAGVEKVLGARLSPGATAMWSYTSKVPLTPAQIAMLRDPQRVSAVRTVVRVETTATGNGAPVGGHSSRLTFTQRLRSQSGTARDVAATVTTPAAQAHAFDSSTTPPLASVGPGASVALGDVTETMPALASKGAQESDLAYWDRLAEAERTGVQANGQVGGTTEGASLESGTGPGRAIPTALGSRSVGRRIPIASAVATAPAAAGPGSH